MSYTQVCSQKQYPAILELSSFVDDADDAGACMPCATADLIE